MIRLEMKNYNMTITRKQQKYQHYLLEIDKCKYLTGEKTLHFNWRQIIQQANFAFSPFAKVLWKLTEKHIVAFTSLNPSDKKGELEQI